MLYEENLRNRNRGEKKASWPRLWTFLWIRAHMEVYTANLQAVCNYSRVCQMPHRRKRAFSHPQARIPSKRPGLGEEAAKAMYITLVTWAIGHLSKQAQARAISAIFVSRAVSYLRADNGHRTDHACLQRTPRLPAGVDNSKSA